jgi:precorrin-6B methylase 2
MVLRTVSHTSSSRGSAIFRTLTTTARQLRKNAYLLTLLRRRYGLAGAAKLAREDVWFDLRNRTDTILPVHNSELYGADEIEERERYVPTPFWVVRQSIELVAGRMPLTGVNFVDMGCGKGKVLFEASRFPFDRVKGIEYSPSIFEIVRRNVAKLGLEHRIELFCVDAMHWHPGPEDRVYFFFNPFSGQVLSKVLDNICAATPVGESIMVIYVNPVWTEAFERRMQLVDELVIDPGTIHVNLYRYNRPVT